MDENIKYEFKVKYKAAPHYMGTFNKIDKPGMHGVFDNRARAEEEVVRCKNWFNLEKVLVKREDKDGVITEEVKVTKHDNVIVWIEAYEDGKRVDDKKKEKSAA